MQFAFEHNQIDLGKCSPAPFTYPPFPKGTKVVAVTLRRGKGRKPDGFNDALSVISLLFLVLLSEGGRE